MQSGYSEFANLSINLMTCPSLSGERIQAFMSPHVLLEHILLTAVAEIKIAVK